MFDINLSQVRGDLVILVEVEVGHGMPMLQDTDRVVYQVREFNLRWGYKEYSLFVFQNMDSVIGCGLTMSWDGDCVIKVLVARIWYTIWSDRFPRHRLCHDSKF